MNFAETVEIEYINLGGNFYKIIVKAIIYNDKNN